MKELDLMRSFRADAPPASAGATARANRAWRAQARGRGPRRRQTLALAAALAAVATAIALIMPTQDGGRLGSPEASAAQTLERAAAAQGVPGRPLRAGEYWYVRTRAEWLTSTDLGGGVSFVEPTLREDWIAIDGYRGFRTRNTGKPQFVGPRDRARWVAAGKPDVFAKHDGRMTRHRPRGSLAQAPFYDGSEQVSYRELLDLPRDPDTLHERLRESAIACECGQSVEQETLVIVGDLLRDTPVPADVRAALLRAAARVPGIELIERIRDVAGRLGTGVAIDSGGTRRALIFDADTYELLGESEFLLEPNNWVDPESGALVSGSAVMEAGVVDSPTAVL